jgi:hypothetical protein
MFFKNSERAKKSARRLKALKRPRLNASAAKIAKKIQSSTTNLSHPVPRPPGAGMKKKKRRKNQHQFNLK